MDIRRIIKDEMQRQGMTQTALEDISGIWQHRISEYLNGKRDANGKTLQNLLMGLNLEIRPARSRRRTRTPRASTTTPRARKRRRTRKRKGK